MEQVKGEEVVEERESCQMQMLLLLLLLSRVVFDAGLVS
jgi:hypothetical protein